MGSYLGTSKTAVVLTSHNAAKGHALAFTFRPVGVLYDERQDNIRDALEASQAPNKVMRYSMDAKKFGKGAGAIEVRAHAHRVQDQVSKMRLVQDALWADESQDESQDLGSMGLVPRELASHLRFYLYECPYVVPWYSLHGISKSVTVMLLVWGIPVERIAHQTTSGTLSQAVDASYFRTRPVPLENGNWEEAVKAHYIVPGYAGRSSSD